MTSIAGRRDVAAKRIGEVHFGGMRGGEQNRRTEQHPDLSFAENSDAVRA